MFTVLLDVCSLQPLIGSKAPIMKMVEFHVISFYSTSGAPAWLLALLGHNDRMFLVSACVCVQRGFWWRAHRRVPSALAASHAYLLPRPGAAHRVLPA